MPQWAKTTQLHIYLLLINRLYLDTLSMRLRTPIAYAIDWLNRSRALPYIVVLLAVVPALRVADRLPDLSPLKIAQFLAVALLLPLFPFHGVYVKAITHSKGYLSPLLGLSLPLLGAYCLANLSSEFQAGILGTVQDLALIGALYSSLKALAQVCVPELLAFASVASYSLLWWFAATSSPPELATSVYVTAVALLTFGLLLAWQFLRKRYGNLELDRMHGLARVMPRFAVVFSLMVMAAVGLPFFALFSAQMELLLRPSLNISPGLVVVCLSWFLTSWYLFRMMQRLLFGRHRADMRYIDLRAAECTGLVILLVLLVMFGVFPATWLQAQQSMNLHYSAMETILWHK